MVADSSNNFLLTLQDILNPDLSLMFGKIQAIKYYSRFSRFLLLRQDYSIKFSKPFFGYLYVLRCLFLFQAAYYAPAIYNGGGHIASPLSVRPYIRTSRMYEKWFPGDIF